VGVTCVTFYEILENVTRVWKSIFTSTGAIGGPAAAAENLGGPAAAAEDQVYKSLAFDTKH
jgi:hypothetical protein